MSKITPAEIDLARARIRHWPFEERQALVRLPEPEVRNIMLAVALMDIRPLATEAAVSVAENIREAVSAPPAAVLPYRANEHPAPAHEGAEKTVAREGEKHVVSPGSHRHKMLRCFSEIDRMTLIQAGQYALDQYGVGGGTIIQWDEGRRRSSELAEFGLLNRVDESLYSINRHGRVALDMCDNGVRWKSDEHNWEPEQLF